MNRYDGTVESLKKKSRRPYSHPNAHTAEELKWIEDYKRRMPLSSLIHVWISLRRNKGYNRSLSDLFREMKKLGNKKPK